MEVNDLLYVNEDFIIEEGRLVKYSGNDLHINVPSGITCIGEEAFKNCKMKSVFISNGVKEIETAAFANCIFLDSVSIPKSVKSIEGFAFDNCKSLKHIELEEGLENILNAAFSRCKNLESIQIPNSILFILETFEDCTKLNYNKFDNGLYLGNETNPYFLFVKTVDKDITSCIINQNTKYIGDYAFKDCKSLESIIIPSTVEFIGNLVFKGCENLRKIHFPPTCNLGWDNFEDCTKLNYSKFDNGLYLGDEANPYHTLIAAKDKDIKSCKLHSQTKQIYFCAFEDCVELEKIIIPKTVTYIMDCAFLRCYSLNVYYELGMDSKDIFWMHRRYIQDVYYFSEAKPNNNDRIYWHYVDGIEKKW
ncbi:MAG: leucine-rich repeat domain-containing protein [Anaeroplasmataceae bacterium]|nr:leucine-rich repeat domain-containing protein [Anaeroplasmataceae bacterium]MDE6413911.1 leucine-rich repeat domain-containing protein [Anaeroplasmataceae bacterium]